jgi:glycosyltransferase involved in cell wall biosynthesis
MSSTPDLSIVICSLNGAPGVDRCLVALREQDFNGEIELIVVDDGSSDDTSTVALRHGAHVIRHEENRGLAASRNDGVRAAHADIVAFLDDDCIPDRGWARAIMGAHGEAVCGVGGPVVPSTPEGCFMGRYLRRHNPLEPLELDLAISESLPYRLKLYLERMWREEPARGRRALFALVGANMSFPRQLLLDVGIFDERFTFGAEELDVCRRVAYGFPDHGYVFEPEARVVHVFEPSLRDAIRRSRAYGKGSARMFRKWPGTRPTFFPFPLAMLALLGIGVRKPAWALAAALTAPHAMFPAGAREAVRSKRVERLADPYVRLAQETWGNLGFVEGAWEFRHLEREPEPEPVAAVLDREPGVGRGLETEVTVAHAS